MLNAIRLRTEYLNNPIGIDIVHPELSWNLAGDSKKQTAYEIRSAHSLAELEKGAFVWNSGKRESSSMVRIPYEPEVRSRERVYWQVRIWDEEQNAGEWSSPAYFEMGLLDEKDWKARWIAGNYETKQGERYPADEFRKKFVLEKDIKQARLYITACGVYEAYLNGERVGDQILTPGLTSYEKRVHYQAYDVTSLLKKKENVWDISLGDGWFRGKLGVFGSTNVYGDTTCVLGQLEITDMDGIVTTVITDKAFGWSNDGPIRFNDMKDGETIEGGKIPTYSGQARETGWDTLLCCSNNVPVKEQESFSPKQILHTPDGSTVLDFGQNLAGYVAFSIKGTKGHMAGMQMGEMLDEDGNFTVKNLITEDTTPEFIPDYCDDTRFQTVEYICGSSEREYWKPKFCVQGFQYVKLENWPEKVKAENFKAIAVYSDMDVTADFSCSSSNIEKLVENTLWSMKGNFLDVPTDCPTRERAPWLGDAQLFFHTGCYFMDFTAFFRKWMRDVFDDQALDGKVYNIVPRGGAHGGMNEYVEGSSGWTDAGILIPYRYWKRYGDKRMLEELYEPMKKLADFMVSRMGDTSDPELDKKLAPSEFRQYVVTTGFHFGEWNEPGSSPMDVTLPKYEEATAYLSYTLQCFAEIAGALGRTMDAQKYQEISEHAKQAYQYYFVKDNEIHSERMCQYVRPIALGLLPEEVRKKAADDLSEMVKKNGYHVMTGFLSTPFVLNVLSDAGFRDEAYRMLENEEYPSWIYEIHQGATTIWENWNGEASRNHYSNGACCDWIFNTVCGIRDDGENHFVISPKPGGSLKKASLCYRSLYGEISCSWEREGENVIYHITVPAGCEAEVLLDGKDRQVLVAGRYQLKG